MQYIYTFADEEITVEIDEKWFQILRGMDREEYNNNHTETRRHTSLTEVTQSGLDDDAEDLLLAALFKEKTMKERLREAILLLQPQQRELLKRVYQNHEKKSDIARQEGVSKMAITNRMKKIFARLKKLLQ